MTRKERIIEKISVIEVLLWMGFEGVYSGQETQQYKCHLHGGGDGKPSARAYEESNSTYCFACGQARNAIDLVIECEGVGFSEACTMLERKFGLPVWETKAGNKPYELRKQGPDSFEERKKAAKTKERYTFLKCQRYEGSDVEEWRKLSESHNEAKADRKKIHS
jgi:DNA primase